MVVDKHDITRIIGKDLENSDIIKVFVKGTDEVIKEYRGRIDVAEINETKYRFEITDTPKRNAREMHNGIITSTSYHKSCHYYVVYDKDGKVKFSMEV